MVIALIAALQFTYILDFMMVMPLGPDLSAALGFPSDQLGWLSVAYTLASVLSGLVCARWLDRCQRRPALLVTIALFGLATLAAVWCHDLPSLLAARALTGFFGGPMVALGMAVIIDITPPAKRGQAIGRVMIGFSIAAIAGVPLALELARWGQWTTPFYAVTGCAVMLWWATAWLLPPMGDHLLQQHPKVSLLALLKQPRIRQACGLQALSQFSAFLVIPSFAAFYVLNLGVPREQLGLLYLTGGIAALITLQGLGRLSDRWGSLPAMALASVGLIAGLLPLLGGTAWWPVWLPFVLFMASNAGRNVALGAATSQVPGPGERAGFMALQSMVQDLAIASAAMVSSFMLSEAVGGQLVGMDRVGLLSIGLVALLLWRCTSWLPRADQPALLNPAASPRQAQAHGGVDGGHE